MTPKISKLFDELEQDLRLTGLEPFANRVAHLKKSLTPLQKKAPVKGIPLKLEITENGKTTEVTFPNEKEAENYLKLKQKERLESAKSPVGVSVPVLFWEHTRPAEYEQKRAEYKQNCAEYWQAVQEQNLDFRVIISRA